MSSYGYVISNVWAVINLRFGFVQDDLVVNFFLMVSLEWSCHFEKKISLTYLCRDSLIDTSGIWSEDLCGISWIKHGRLGEIMSQVAKLWHCWSTGTFPNFRGLSSCRVALTFESSMYRYMSCVIHQIGRVAVRRPITWCHMRNYFSCFSLCNCSKFRDANRSFLADFILFIRPTGIGVKIYLFRMFRLRFWSVYWSWTLANF